MMKSQTYFTSIIIPVKQEYENLKELLPYILETTLQFQIEIIIVNVEKDARTESLCRSLTTSHTPVYHFISPTCGRGAQLSYGASMARGNIYYFLHADAQPPERFLLLITQELEKGYQLGCFKMQWDKDISFLRINTYLSGKKNMFIGGGDQSMFIRAEKYNEIGGFRPDLKIMEDFEFFKRAKKHCDYTLIDDPITVSARKYQYNHYCKVQLVNLLTIIGFRLGISQKMLLSFYHKSLF